MDRERRVLKSPVPVCSRETSSRFHHREGITCLGFFPKHPGKVQTGHGNGKQLNSLEDGTALRTFQRRGKNKMKTQEFRRKVGCRLPWGEENRQDEQCHHDIENPEIERLLLGFHHSLLICPVPAFRTEPSFEREFIATRRTRLGFTHTAPDFC